MMKRKRLFSRMGRVPAVTFALVMGVVFVTGCGSAGGTKLGVDIPPDAEVVELASVVEKPAAYNGKKVVMKGVIDGQCPALCEFFFKDGLHKVTIFPQGYKFPKLTKGKPVTVYAQVTAGEGQVVFSALGVNVE
ncbi:MAG: hypothetical protein GF344_14970 [Chitinivibrionales bacterium]|nr:hypothetical protein [Chitinivibrionales bacterium]MBD3358008.1 hypothetical protein [Chitinivibrionales bacterium]